MLSLLKLTQWQVIGIIFVAGILVGSVPIGCISYKTGYYKGHRQGVIDSGGDPGWFEPNPGVYNSSPTNK